MLNDRNVFPILAELLAVNKLPNMRLCASYRDSLLEASKYWTRPAPNIAHNFALPYIRHRKLIEMLLSDDHLWVLFEFSLLSYNSYRSIWGTCMIRPSLRDCGSMILAVSICFDIEEGEIKRSKVASNQRLEFVSQFHTKKPLTKLLTTNNPAAYFTF